MTVDATPHRSGRTLEGLPSTLVVTLGGALGLFMTGAVSVQIDEDISFGPAMLGIGTAVFFATSALSSPIAGQVAHRRGNRMGMRLAAVAALAAAVTIGLAASTVQILVGLSFAGVASGMAAPACNAFLAQTIDARHRALAFGIKQSAVPMGTFFGGLAVPLIALTVGWRAAYLIPGIVAVVALATTPASAGATKQASAGADAPPVRGLPILCLALGTSFGAAAGSALGTFIVPALVAGGTAEGAAGRAAAIGAGATILARVAIGAYQDRVAISPLRIVAAILVVGTAALALLATGPTWGLALLVPLAFIGSWGWPGLYAYAVVQAFPQSPAAASGYTQAGAFTGAAIAPFVFGVIAEAASYELAFAFLAALTAASATTIWISAGLVERSAVAAA